jgi:hypothetical protein
MGERPRYVLPAQPGGDSFVFENVGVVIEKQEVALPDVAVDSEYERCQPEADIEKTFLRRHLVLRDASRVPSGG